MRWNPYINALAAAAYIGLVASLMQYVSAMRHDTPDSLIDPIALLSLLVFSASVMGFLFFYHPTTLLVEGKRTEAVSYFFKMLGTFGVLTVLAFVLVISLG